ncbi:DoxX family protein [Nocardia sp. NBC_00565]|uniref:DoxX family protein n=1 Tax=Nocardia sp. NBC_00565 TaxID=2975993 RepID=UPI002E821798|nr:DoxX family protein [Nocardia sp. NBC_00565]WUC07536.1 DoxX family protein [Nocardia sp. NBC_00565]
MTVAFIVLAVLLAVGFLPLGAAKVLAVAPIRQRAEQLGFSVTAFRGIGALEIAGALGVLVGIVWWPLGATAGIGLVLLMIGALIAHAKVGDGVGEYAPSIGIGVLALAYVVTVFGAHL